MQILPAIDLKGRKVVRLYKGDFDTVHQVARDPVETARAFCALELAGSILWIWMEPEMEPEKMERSSKRCQMWGFMSNWAGESALCRIWRRSLTWAYLGPSSVPPLSPIPNWYPTL